MPTDVLMPKMGASSAEGTIRSVCHAVQSSVSGNPNTPVTPGHADQPHCEP